MFEDTEAATKAVEEVQGFELFEKPMHLEYAKTQSDATVLKDGTEEEFETHRRRRLAEKGELSKEGVYQHKLIHAQRGSKLLKRPSCKRSSSDRQQGQKLDLHGQSNRPGAQVSNRQIQLQVLSYQRNISRRTRFFLFKTYQKMSVWTN